MSPTDPTDLGKIPLEQFREALRHVQSKLGADGVLPDGVDERDLQRAMRADGEVITACNELAGSLIQRIIHGDTDERMAVVRNARASIHAACEGMEGGSDFGSSLWSMVVCNIVAVGYQRMVEMMLEGQQAVVALRAMQGAEASDKLAHEVSSNLARHLHQVELVVGALRCDGMAAVATVQLHIDLSERKRAACNDNGKGWCDN